MSVLLKPCAGREHSGCQGKCCLWGLQQALFPCDLPQLVLRVWGHRRLNHKNSCLAPMTMSGVLSQHVSHLCLSPHWCSLFCGRVILPCPVYSHQLSTRPQWHTRQGRKEPPETLGYLVNLRRTLDSAQWTSSPTMLASGTGRHDSLEERGTGRNCCYSSPECCSPCHRFLWAHCPRPVPPTLVFI